MEKTLDLIYKVEMLEDLVQAQESALHTAGDLLTVKSQLIELLEDEIRMHKRNNLLICIMNIVIFILFIILLGLFCIS